ncbi:MMPL family transporter [Cytobacillus sp. FSL W7-1323]|uniref:MMPL domain-containing protein n=1 Tax=Cytobacillus kochii TaxID=859143 RepID=A0A248TJU5_9BACI|nr:MMPL family transporter [Cytobacillus kochii]ASV68399.1 MMPL domain-containing protein [Cytobacillus kochii]MED1608048.1 MMPL family transporter [Cytobacillus kochii]
MKNLLHTITDRVATKKGAWITIVCWLVIALGLAFFAPNAKDYQVGRIATLPEDSQSIIAQNKLEKYFPSADGIPAILVFQDKNDEQLETSVLAEQLNSFKDNDIKGITEVIPLEQLPPEALKGFFSDDQSIAVIPLQFASSMESGDIQTSIHQMQDIVEDQTDLNFWVTGPAGISADSLDLFSRADVVLILSTVALILVLLIVIYRSPLLAIIPLLAAGFVYEVVMKSLGIFGSLGLNLSQQTISIMLILLFAAVVDYSLFVFSRFREALKNHENSFEAMKVAMRSVGMPVFFSGGTVLAAMLVLFFAEFGDYRNFAPTFATAMAIIMISSITLIPALFALFGRKAFWPKVPQVGDHSVKGSSFWSKVGQFVVKKPIVSVVSVGVILVVSALNISNLDYEFDTIKSFPEDMPSRVGYEVLEENFSSGDLAPTTVLVESSQALSEEQISSIVEQLSSRSEVNEVRPSGTAENNQVLQLSLTFNDSPYAIESINELEKIVNEKEELLDNSNIDGDIYFSGETASSLDDRKVNNNDILLIVTLETVLIFLLLIALTKSIKMPIYMMGTILISFLAALGLGTFLTEIFFGIDAVSNRVPLYAFVFLVALGIDYNIMLVSRFQEERKHHSVKEAVQLAVSHTGGVISSAGLILAATFAVLMTQPIELLFVFGFIVAVGILLDTFLIRGVLLPGLIVLLEKDKQGDKQKSKSANNG